MSSTSAVSCPSLFKKFQSALDLPPPADCGPVAVAMSGGVDSSTVAAMLAKLGYKVVGITLKLYGGTVGDRPGTCCAGRDIRDAKKVAAHYGFSHYVLNYEERFQRSVIDPFTQSYLKGETPIPCVLCNQTVKFSDLLHHAQKLGCTALVTGHYIQRKECDLGPELHTAHDMTKDQSYFLFTTTQEELAFLRFPLGGLLKEETRTLAEQLALDLAQKPESQDICFVGGKHYTDFLAKTAPHALDPGAIVDESGQVLGTHKGIAHYTIGQRKGLNLSVPFPLYVVALNAADKEVIVGPEEALLCHKLSLENINWLYHSSFLPPEQPLTVRLRSSASLNAARLILNHQEKRALVVLDIPEAGISPGQACVFYSGTQILGGGWIKKTLAPPYQKKDTLICSYLPKELSCPAQTPSKKSA